MKTTIINQLNAIRFLEHRKLYEKFDLILGSNKKREAIRVPYDMIEQISRRHKEAYSEKITLLPFLIITNSGIFCCLPLMPGKE